MLVGRNLRLHVLPWLVCKNADGNSPSPFVGRPTGPVNRGDMVISNLIFVPLFWGLRAVRHHGGSRVSRAHVSIDRNLILFLFLLMTGGVQSPEGGCYIKSNDSSPI